MVPVSANDVLRLAVHADGNTVLNVEPVISYKKEVTLSFFGNGGRGTLPQTIHAGEGAWVTVPQCELSKEGYLFDGWGYGANVYQPGDNLKLEKDKILKAIWKQKPKPPVIEEQKDPVPLPDKPQETISSPGKPKLTLKRTGKKVKLTWKKVKNADGYEISMKTGKGKYKVIAKKGKSAKSFKKTVKSKKVVYFRIRAYRKSGKGMLYGKYSAVKKVKLKS